MTNTPTPALPSNVAELPATLEGQWETPEGFQMAKNYLSRHRERLCWGNLTDMEAAHRIAMLYRNDPEFEPTLSMAKDRIRYLSVQLALANARASTPTDKEAEEKIFWVIERAALKAIAEGYPIEVIEDRYILVENPKFRPDNGSSPKLLIDTWQEFPSARSASVTDVQPSDAMKDYAWRCAAMLRFLKDNSGECLGDHPRWIEKINELLDWREPPTPPAHGEGELLKTATLLLQNAEGCAADHYGHDIETMGVPGWLRDARKIIEAASDRALSHAPSPPQQDGSGLVEALRKIAEQPTLAELSERGEDNEGDFEGAYDALIETARAALASTPKASGGE